MTGIRNRIGDSFLKSAFKEESEQYALEYEDLKKIRQGFGCFRKLIEQRPAERIDEVSKTIEIYL